MRRTREVKAATHAAILAHASRLFRQHGIAATSVGEVMAAAGLTHGGFYRHFENKDALVAAVIRATFDGILGTLEERAATVGRKEAVNDYLSYYLSDEHVAHPALGCPVATLGSELSRSPEALRVEFGASLNRSLAGLARGFSGPESARREMATREFAMRVGAIVIARASDAATARDVLAACRKTGNSPQGEREDL